MSGDLCTIATGRPAGRRPRQPGRLVGRRRVECARGRNDGKKALAGLITFGLADENVIAWHWSDNLESFLTKPHEPTFRASDYMSKVTPLPLAMIQSGHDEYVGVDESKRLFAAAGQPKRFDLVQADNHRFDGNHKEFFLTLREGLQWIDKAH